MITTLFSKFFAPRPIWKETSREFLKRRIQATSIFDVDTFDYYAVTYTNVISGKTRIVEESVLVF